MDFARVPAALVLFAGLQDMHMRLLDSFGVLRCSSGVYDTR